MSDGSAATGASGACWFTGPVSGRHDYSVSDPERFPGGQGEVFPAHLTRTTPPTKVSLKQLAGVSAERATELLDRDQLLRRLNHPGLVRHIETFMGPGLFQDGEVGLAELTSDLVYVVAEWVPGTPLAEMARVPTIGEAIRIIGDVAAAVTYLHENGLTHRDLHPGNVVVRADGTAVVIDLGYTRPAAGHATTLMRGGAGFIPPERDNDPSIATIECDVFQVGALAVYLLLGDPNTRTPLLEIASKLEARLAGRVAYPGQCAQAVVQLLSTDPRERPQDLLAAVAPLAAATPSRNRNGTRRWRLPVAVVGPFLLVVVLIAAWRLHLIESPTEPKGTPLASRCAFRPSQPAAGLNASSAKFLPAIASVVAAHGGCASDAAYQYGPMVVRRLGTPTAPDGAAIASVAGHAIYLTQAQWSSYTQIGGKSGSEAPIAAGPPLAVTVKPGFSEVVLTHGLLLGAGPNQPHFWIPELAVLIWQQQGGAGGPLQLPTSNPYPLAGNIEQDYQTGYMSLENGDIHVVEVPNRGDGLPPAKILAGKLIDQIDGTAWYVDAAGIRHWIPDGAVWSCYGGNNNVAARNLTGYTVATLGLGPPAHC